MIEPVQIPESLTWLRDSPNGAAWLVALPALLDRACGRWRLAIDGPPYEGGVAGLVLPVRRDGMPFVLKLQWPHPECADEAAALTAWKGAGAVRLCAHHAQDHALLMDRCEPGTSLASSNEDPIGEMIALLPKLWIETTYPFRTLAEEAAGWSVSLPEAWERAGRPCDRSLVDAALDHIEALSGTQPDQVLVHQDLHGHNVLASGDRWLAIDPKPLIGERAFSLAPVIRSFEFGEGRHATVARLDRMTSALDLPRDRALGWTVAQTMAWAFDGTRYFSQHIETVRWLMDAR